ncbi:uncharacterized protein B0H18DRAFT_1081422 [Fomitopsis serialis]|uniref:uncharacterized protein n=1 Tax=Fomitopsis serialis TaxID=139415 RepID=UPI0020074883|nr:uncharacterized protein B0H18DRAFT_1081422 [Neoantrodia serialis]KAH9937157.1 hypothetical protein B0H18DRAFT_1081422 [Neoantrodia serialis]
MSTIPAPLIVLSKEEWPDADFDFPDGDSIHASDAEDDKDDTAEDWDVEMDLGKTGGAKAQHVLDGIAARAESSRKSSQMFTIRPPLPTPPDEEDEEGVSTIKVAALPKLSTRPPPPVIDEDFEDDFALPSELTQLSLRPVSHRSSKASLEWGDRDQTSSSQSSDAYSTLGFADNASSSNYTSASLPETETEDEDEDEDGELDGLVIPTGLFETQSGGKKLAKILEIKKKTAFTDERVKITSPDPEDDFEMGLVIDNDVELSPSRLLTSKSTKRAAPSNRSRSAPPRPPTAIRPPSRLKTDRAKSPNTPPISSASQLRKIGTPPSPHHGLVSRQALAAAPTSPVSFLTPKPGGLRIQKSHSGLKPTSPSSTHKLGRKASLPSLSESSHNAQASGSGSGSSPVQASYNAPTASSRAKMQANSTSRIHGLEYNVPPTRPSTPSSNPAALRLTMPTSSSRWKSRTPISSVFPAPTSAVAPLPAWARANEEPASTAPKVMKRPKRQRTYGDGAELDGFDDLPLDRDKEEQFRVEPKGYGNRVPGATYAKAASSGAHDSALGKGTLRRKGKRELSSSSYELSKGAPPAKTLKRTGRIDFPGKPESPPAAALSKHSEDLGVKKKKTQTSPSAMQTRRKPTLIRNLGGTGATKGERPCNALSILQTLIRETVVGEMKWNPITLRWEGNDQALRDFDSAVGSSTRPALITHLTGSSMGSPVSSFAAGARVVGTMIFDPSRMCWISTLPPDEEEPDVFADLADDEDEDEWEAKGGTIRASQQISATPSEATRTQPPSPARSHSRTRSGSESDRGSRASMVCDVDASFADNCRVAQERHRAEMKGWLSLARTDSSGEPDRSYLFEIRALACRQY